MDFNVLILNLKRSKFWVMNSRLYFFFCLFFLFFTHSYVLSQNRVEKGETEASSDYDINYSQSVKKPVNQILLNIGANKLPDWFFMPPQSTNDTIYAIGISDPFVSEKIAFVQAKLRSIATLALMTEAFITGINENYSKNTADEFEELFKCKNSKILTGTLNVSDSFLYKIWRENSTCSIRKKYQ